MKDHIVVTEDQLIQCKNDIVTHYFLNKINCFSLEYYKKLGIEIAELSVGSSREEVVLQRAYKTSKKEELNEIFSMLITQSQNKAPFVRASETTYINLDNLHKIKKTYDKNQEKVYTITFNDGLRIYSRDISDELRTALIKRANPEGLSIEDNSGDDESQR